MGCKLLAFRTNLYCNEAWCKEKTTWSPKLSPMHKKTKNLQSVSIPFKTRSISLSHTSGPTATIFLSLLQFVKIDVSNRAPVFLGTTSCFTNKHSEKERKTVETGCISKARCSQAQRIKQSWQSCFLNANESFLLNCILSY